MDREMIKMGGETLIQAGKVDTVRIEIGEGERWVEVRDGERNI